MEGAYFQKGGVLKGFSTQQLVECAQPDGICCNGGIIDNAFKYAEQNYMDLA
jgi:hypothetical protein